jgi:mannose-6-phosphate isomerase
VTLPPPEIAQFLDPSGAEVGAARVIVSSMTKDEGAERPWGNYVTLSEAHDHKVKRITVRPGSRLSYQRHQHRSEHWFVVSGSGIVVRDGEEKAVRVGSAVDIRTGSLHRMQNVGRDDLIFIEVQLGTYLGEDDIERLEDDFGRAAS